MNYPKLSIITPVYNGERFIEGCIKNVIKQNCSDAEHIIVDGGSTDRTVETIKRYAQKYPHIRWISEKDKGQSDAMNKGIRIARGEILGFLNVDDFYEPNVLKRILEVFKDLPDPTFLVGNCKVWGDDGILLFVNKPVKLKVTDLLLGWYRNPWPANPSAYFYHKSLHQKIGSYIMDAQAMDLDFLLRAVQGANVRYIDETWGNFRRTKDTKTYKSIKNGQIRFSTNHILEVYKRKLSLPQRCEFTVKEIMYTIKYYSKNIQKLPQLFIYKMRLLLKKCKRILL